MTKARNTCPYEILGLSQAATNDEVKKAYRQALTQYHPDKVSHLGEDIKKVAQNKTHQIRQAYEQIADKSKDH